MNRFIGFIICLLISPLFHYCSVKGIGADPSHSLESIQTIDAPLPSEEFTPYHWQEFDEEDQGVVLSCCLFMGKT